MKCTDARSLMLAALDGALEVARREALDAHLAECAECRAEMRRVRVGAEALRRNMYALAPDGPHLTARRLERLLMAHDEVKPRAVRLWDNRRFVAAASVAAILVAAVSLGLQGAFWLRGSTPAERAPLRYVQAPQSQPPRRTPVVLTAVHGDEPLRVARARPADRAAADPWAASAQPAGLVETDSPGLVVPVDNAFYDPDTSSHWW